MLEYQRADATMTLGRGLEEYYASRDDLVRGRGLSDPAREFFRCHDAAHVVFGCGTSLLDEAAVKVWSLFGTTGGPGLLRGYRLAESQEIYRRIGWGSVVRVALRSLVVVPRVGVRCLRMRARWPWSAFEVHLDDPLLELRRRYGIRVLELEGSGSP